MKDSDILALFTEILRGLLGDESIVLTLDTTRDDVEDWDSYQYVNFIVAVESELGIKFSISDVESFNTVGDILSETKELLGR